MASVLLSIVVRKWLISKPGVSRDLISGNPGVLKKNAGNKQAWLTPSFEEEQCIKAIVIDE